MKLTKSKLKHIIKEEFDGVVKEWTIGGFGTGNTELYDKLRQEASALEDAINAAAGEWPPSATDSDLANFRESTWDIWREFSKHKKTFNDKQANRLRRLDPSNPENKYALGLKKLRDNIEGHGTGVAKAAADEKAAKDAAESDAIAADMIRNQEEKEKRARAGMHIDHGRRQLDPSGITPYPYE
jgi:hypothetical protein